VSREKSGEFGRLLVVDDDPLILQCLKLALPPPEYEVLTATTVAAGLSQFIRHEPDAVLLDIQLPDQSGLAALQDFRHIDRRVPIILMTGFGTATTVIEAISGGAFQCVPKPFEPDEILPIIDSALETGRLARRPVVLPDEVDGGRASDQVDQLIGTCKSMVEVFRMIGRVALRDVPVLIIGEPGTEKEVVARAIYQHSHRRELPFYPIDCSVISERELERELFGYVTGAFPAADQSRAGKLEICGAGTLFLDDIADLTPNVQTKLLRLLEQHQFERLGSDHALASKVRFIAGTRRDLSVAVQEKTFRSDLFHQLSPLTIQLPPLRQRGDDLPVMIEHFFQVTAKSLDQEYSAVSPEALARLTAYPWPGNVRELKAVVKQVLLRASGPVITPAFLPDAIQGCDVAPKPDTESQDWVPGLRTYVQQLLAGNNVEIAENVSDAVDRVVLTETLATTRGNISEASQRLGISRPTLRSRLKHLGLRGGNSPGG
jgi:two-component system nitrogen regulation response regulator GlnG